MPAGSMLSHRTCFCWQVCKRVAKLTARHDCIVSSSKGAFEWFQQVAQAAWLSVWTTRLQHVEWVCESLIASSLMF